MSDPAAPIRAVLFDLDGTLVDNMQYHIAAWIETGRELGAELTAEQVMRDFAGRRNEEILPTVARRPLSAQEMARIAHDKEARYRALYAPHLTLMSGAAALLTQLTAAGIAIGIASAAPKDNRDFVLSGLGRGPDAGAVGGAEEVSRGKPARDMYREAPRRSGMAPQHTLVFEDARLGVQAACAAGMRACGITTGDSPHELIAAGAIATCPDFRSLPDAIAGLLR